MNQKYTSNDNQNDEFTHDNQDIDYQNLITRLKEISETITLLEKQYSNKFSNFWLKAVLIKNLFH